MGPERTSAGRGRVIRTIVVIIALVIGWSFAIQSPLFAAAFYLWIAYFRPESWAWSDVFATLNLSYFAGAFLLIRTAFSPVKFRVDYRNLMMFLFLALGLVSSLLGPNQAYSMSYWQEFAKTIVVSYLLTVLITDAKDLRLILTVIVLSLGFEAGKQGWATLVLSPGAPNTNSVPFLGDNNLVAVGMAMLLPMVGALGITSTGWQKRAYQFLSIGVLYRAVSTYSRGGLLAIGAVGGMYFWRSQHKLRTLAAFAIAVALVLPVLPQAYWDRMATITAPAEERDDSQQSRLHFWQVAVAMANDRPLLGVGHAGYPRAYNAYDWTDGQYLTNRAVHSAWFGVLGELGYPGLLLFGAIVFTSLRACRRVRKSAQRGEIPGPLGPYAIGLESALIAFIVGGSFVSFQYNEMLWHFFALTMALEAVAVKEAATERARLAALATPRPVAAVRPAAMPEPEFAWG
ncbi:MAG: putative O-glycosylation ligase, exosortase A system-associated [Acidobacteriota bacterium]|nr:putative O-glycosylation ligase, exosortase A system-associated [Acidobacteriota bacterium]